MRQIVADGEENRGIYARGCKEMTEEPETAFLAIPASCFSAACHARFTARLVGTRQNHYLI